MAEPLSDEAIDNLVKMVKTAELLAETMGIPVHKVVGIILKAAQQMASKEGGFTLETLKTTGGTH